MIAMPTQNISLRLKLTDNRRLPRKNSTQVSRKIARNTHENSHGTIHFNNVDITSPHQRSHSHRAPPAAVQPSRRLSATAQHSAARAGGIAADCRLWSLFHESAGSHRGV